MYLNLFMNILSIKSIIPLFEKLSFKEKIDLLAEIFLILEHDELLPDNVDGYEIVRMVIKIKYLKTKLLFENLIFSDNGLV